MDRRPIGIFDSGLGGLCALSRLTELLPDEKFIYLGDTARVPYGDKSLSALLDCADGDFKFLLSRDVKAILIACGTVSSNLTAEQFEKVPVLCSGVIAPAAKKAVENSKNKKIGIIATAASIRAGAYKRAVLSLCPDTEVFDTACPEFVPLIESGKTDFSLPEVKAAVEKYLLPLKSQGIDTLILGCTHYPMLESAIRMVLPDAALIDVGAEAAESIAESLCEKGLLGDGKGSCEFFASSDAEGFRKKAAAFLKRKIDKVNLISL